MKSRANFVALMLTTLLAACGGDPDSDPAPEATGSSDDTEVTTASSEPGGSEETVTTQSAAETEVEEAPAAGAGTATLTIGDMTVEFTGLTCYYDAEAAEAYGDEDAIFLAVAQDGETTLGAWIRDMGFELFEVGYFLGDDSGWHMGYTDVENDDGNHYTVEEGRITAQGEFTLTVDQTETETEQGSLVASCG